MSFPESVDGCKVRKLGDGSYWVPRATDDSLYKLSKQFVRVGNKPVFFDPDYIESPVENLASFFQTNNIVLVGKGPSLAIHNFDFETNKYLFINDSVLLAGKLPASSWGYVIAQDRFNLPILNEYYITTILRAKEHPNCNIIIPEKYGLNSSTPTAILAVAMLISFGVDAITLVGFDSLETGNCEYAPGFNHGKLDPKRFLTYNEQLRFWLNKVHYLHAS